MVHGDLTDRDSFGKLGHLVLARSLRAWDTRFQPDPLSYCLKRVFSGHPADVGPGAHGPMTKEQTRNCARNPRNPRNPRHRHHPSSSSIAVRRHRRHRRHRHRRRRRPSSVVCCRLYGLTLMPPTHITHAMPPVGGGFLAYGPVPPTPMPPTPRPGFQSHASLAMATGAMAGIGRP